MNLSKEKKIKKRRYHADLPELPFTMACVGPSRSGKSNCIRNLLLRRELMRDVFDYIFIFCPSIDLNGDFDELGNKKKPIVKKIKTFDEKIIQEIMSQQEFVIKKYGKSKSPQTLLIFDDCFDDPKFTRSKLLQTICFRGRHMKISMILSGQKLSMMGTACRANLTHMMFFRPANYSELDFFIEENVEKKKRREFSEAFKEVWKTKYEFVFIDYLNSDLSKRFRKGLSEPMDVEL